ncbi:methylmalonyl Co-A mutase-associated GTPase MeaB [Thermaerobacter subterraneus]|uniref:LAO/AO transport system ATPase n=1 Tax=Thermaerobacter subterraneus DSM 13965 TaxID=867903 RepID=K6P479_9FIRM|nr:methylmalonyl Co-A mutase-associated GTPase MeaB [Thermaerobacter subterraneus]EKP95860.1 LAO/AO transport system ATPase [Thermaerobacter subterraneus DSM 13965]
MTRAARPDQLAEGVLAGDRRALARAITWVENRHPGADELLRRIYPHTGRAHVVGLTGAPGVGKSTLAAALARHLRDTGQRVGLVAVDPSSPFTGGALLGDRIRFSHGPVDDGVFFRSLASRGQVGGLSRATGDVIHLLDAAGMDTVLVETVGAGQSEVEIMRYAHTVVVVLAPGLGDDVQAAKAGILEAGDILVVNKADQPGASRTVQELRQMLDLGAPRDPGWKPPVLEAAATAGTGVDELVRTLRRHREHLESTAAGALRHRWQAEEALRQQVLARLWERLKAGGRWDELARAVAGRQLSPGEAAERLLAFLRQEPARPGPAPPGATPDALRFHGT